LTHDRPLAASSIGPLPRPLVLSSFGPQSPVWPCVQTRRTSGGLELLSCELVVGELGEEVLGEVRAAVAEIDVVGMLPDIEHEQCLALSARERQAGTRGLRNFEAVILAEDQPRPARAELTDRRGLEGLLELLDAAEVTDEPLLQIPRDAAAARRQAIPEKAVIPVLARIVEDRSQVLAAMGELDQLLERLALERIVLVHQAVERGDVSLMVLAMMELEGLLAHAAGGECARRKRKRGEGEGHGCSPAIGGRGMRAKREPEG